MIGEDDFAVLLPDVLVKDSDPVNDLSLMIQRFNSSVLSCDNHVYYRTGKHNAVWSSHDSIYTCAHIHVLSRGPDFIYMDHVAGALSNSSKAGISTCRHTVSDDVKVSQFLNVILKP